MEQKIFPTKHSLFWTWSGMHRRCFDIKHNGYRYYGECGITICQRWKENFFAFVLDMGEKPGPDYSIDRIDGNGHYSCGYCQECKDNSWPANCRWATPKQQADNRTYKKQTERILKRIDSMPERHYTNSLLRTYIKKHFNLRQINNHIKTLDEEKDIEFWKDMAYVIIF